MLIIGVFLKLIKDGEKNKLSAVSNQISMSKCIRKSLQSVAYSNPEITRCHFPVACMLIARISALL